jgi:hypothetical protein
VKEPHAAPEAQESITSLKDTRILYRQTGVSQICPQLWELGVKILLTRSTACNNMVGLFEQHHQIKAVTKTKYKRLS